MFDPLRYAALFGGSGFLFGALAAGLALSGVAPAFWVVTAAVAYLGISLVAVSVSYLLTHHGVAVDQAFQGPGTRALFDALLLPYRMGARPLIRALGRFDAMDLMHPVGTRLYVGRFPQQVDRAKLDEAGVTAVVNLCAEAPSGRRAGHGRETIYLPVLDGAAPSPGQFRAALDWIVERHAQGHSVLVHCAQGRGRSVTVAAAALCRLGLAGSHDESVEQITSARPRARLSRGQQAALRRLAAGRPAAAVVPA